MKVIIAAEEEAQRIIQIAQRKAKQSIDDEHEAGSETVSLTVARAESEIAHMTRVMDHKATEEAMELASTTANRQAALFARADRRLDDAAAFIVERIVTG